MLSSSTNVKVHTVTDRSNDTPPTNNMHVQVHTCTRTNMPPEATGLGGQAHHSKNRSEWQQANTTCMHSQASLHKCKGTEGT